MKILVCSTLFFLFSSIVTFAQKSEGVLITGQVIEKQSIQPLEFATVKIAHAQTKAVIRVAITDQEGKFSVKVDSNNFSIEVSFIGFKPLLAPF